MGVDDLWKFCIPGVKAKPQQPFSSAKNTRVAVDISCLSHVCVARPKVASMKNIKKITHRSNELTNLVIKWMVSKDIKYVCAPFEVEWQCVYLEHMKLVDAVMSIDGDCFLS